MNIRSCTSHELVCGIALCIVAITLAGCGGTKHPETAVSKGKVTIDGKVVSRGSVRFYPEKGKQSSASIQKDGSFELMTYEQGDGAIVGKNRATVIVVPSLTDENDLGKGETSPIPTKYGSEAQSGLEFVVKPGVENTFHLDLKSK